MTAAPFGEAIAHLRAAVGELLAADVTGLEQAELVAALQAFEVHRRRLEAVDQRLLMQANDTSLATTCGQPGLSQVLTTVLLLDPREARHRVARAIDLAPRRALTGEQLPPSLPSLAGATSDGAVSAAQADVIIAALEHIPPSAPAAAWSVAERLLVEAARVEPPRLLRRTAAELLARLDPDGPEPAEERAERQRGYTLVKHRDGWSTPRGRLNPEATAAWEAIFDSLAAPQPTDGADGGADPRSPAQRRHDAVAEAAARLLRSGTLPAAGGIPVTVLATTAIRDLAAAAGVPAAGERAGRLGLAELAEQAGLDLGELLAADSGGLALLGHGQTVSARALLAMACEAEVIPVVFNDVGGVLAYGTGRRLASRGQRLALAARDGGCSFPGCDRPAAWTEVHHVVPWAAGGPTDLDNTCLVCRFHHRTFESAGWEVIMRDGVPLWLPPPWLDAQRRPRRNTVHHPPEIVFRRPSAA